MAENKGNCWLKITEIIRGVIIISRVFKVCSGVCDVSGLDICTTIVVDYMQLL